MIWACSNTFVQKPILKIACRTGCETAVRISLQQKCGLYPHSEFIRIKSPGLLHLGKYYLGLSQASSKTEDIAEPELCADELVVGVGVGWSYDRRRRRAAHFSSAAAWLYNRRRRRRQTGWESTETAHSFLVLQGSATSPVIRWAAGVEKLTVNMHAVHNFTVLMS